MKTSLIRNVFCFVLLIALVAPLTPAFAVDDDMLKQAQEFVHQAWNPGGDPPSSEDRTKLLEKAFDLAHNSPEHRVHGHRKHAVQLIRAALDEIKNGDPNKKVNGYLHDADAELREALSE